MRITEFKQSVPKELIKKGLIFYSTEKDKPHKDSKGRELFFTDSDIKKLVENTNNYLSYSSGIPIFTEHNKDVNNQVGEIDEPLEVRQITEDDINSNPKWEHLLGRWGVFSDSVRIMDDDLIDKINRGLSKTLSAGIDLKNFHIREVSLVGVPAIPNTVLFHDDMGNIVNFNALLLDEALKDKDESGKQRQQAQKIFDTLLDVLDNVKSVSSQDEVEGNMQKDVLIQQNLSQFQNKILEMYKVSKDEQVQNENQSNQTLQKQTSQQNQSPKFNNLQDFVEYSNQLSKENEGNSNMQFYYLNGVPVVGYDDDVSEYGLYGKARYHVKAFGDKLKKGYAKTVAEGRKKRNYDINKKMNRLMSQKNQPKSRMTPENFTNRREALAMKGVKLNSKEAGLVDAMRAVRKPVGLGVGALGAGAAGGYALGRRKRDRR